MATRSDRRISAEEYLALERQSETRNEFLDGEIFAMGGASRRHNLVTGNAFAALHAQLIGRDCEVHSSDLRVKVPATGLYAYPDVVVVCGGPQLEDDTHLDTLLNPTLIIEVLSPTTADYDRGGKFAHYRTLPSLAEYLVLAQDRVHAEHASRQDDGSWLLTETSQPGEVLDLPSIGCRLDLKAVYARVLDAPPATGGS